MTLTSVEEFLADRPGKRNKNHWVQNNAWVGLVGLVWLLKETEDTNHDYSELLGVVMDFCKTFCHGQSPFNWHLPIWGI